MVLLETCVQADAKRNWAELRLSDNDIFSF